MQTFIDTLRRTGGLEALAQRTGLSAIATRRCVEVLLPLVSGGIKRLAERDSGVSARSDVAVPDALCQLLEEHGGAELAAAVLSDTDHAAGDVLTSAIFGDADAISAVCVASAEKSEVSVETSRTMLPLLLMLIGGYISAISSGQPDDRQHVHALLELDVPDNALDSVLPRQSGI
ncbi:MAG: hypothetical protein KDE63_07090 [Novosphingobium sp.]|nr:hypothetical protein [Novosphingobium sp.]